MIPQDHFPWKPVRMGDQALPTFMQVARQRPLMEVRCSFLFWRTCLRGFVSMMFSDAFTKDAFIDRHTNILKVMVSSWLFPCFPAGVLIKDPPRGDFESSAWWTRCVVYRESSSQGSKQDSYWMRKALQVQRRNNWLQGVLHLVIQWQMWRTQE